MAFTHSRDLLLQQLLRRCNPGVKLPRGIQRDDPRTVEQKNLPPRLVPACDRTIDLRPDLRRLSVFTLQVQDAAKLRQELHGRLRVVDDANRTVDLEAYTRKLLSLGIPALLHQDIRQSHDVTRRGGIEFALI